jgi:glycosyltransferase involved in cell wall biosynthesis
MPVEVSVIIAAYNEESCIDDCLRTICQQTHPSYEVIVVDDGSTDRTPDIVRKYNNVKLISQPHKGPGVARNNGVAHSRGEILVFVDADMTFHPDFLTKLVEPIKQGGVCGTFTKEEYVANWDNPWARCWTINCGLPDRKRHPIDHPDTDKVFRAIRRSDFLSVGGYDDMGYSEDHSLSRKLGKLAIHAQGAICYHKNPESLRDVYLSARWYGRGDQLGTGLMPIVKHTLPFSLKTGFIRAFRYRNPHYLLFKIVYDFAVLTGRLERLLRPARHTK